MQTITEALTELRRTAPQQGNAILVVVKTETVSGSTKPRSSYLLSEEDYYIVPCENKSAYLGIRDLSSNSRGEWTMTERREVCTCEKCGNEAEMTITCELVEVPVAPNVVKKKQRETRVCTVCGNEADMIIDFGE